MAYLKVRDSDVSSVSVTLRQNQWERIVTVPRGDNLSHRGRASGVTDDKAKENPRVLEHAALGASFLCMIHCLGLPLVIAALPAFGSILPVGPGFHLGMLAFAVPASGFTLLTGQWRHGTARPLAVGVVGLCLLALGALCFEGTWRETLSTVLGAVLLAVAHISNLRLRKLCD